MFLQTMMLVAYGGEFLSEQFKESHKNSMAADGSEMDKYMETCVFLQISNSSAILILSARTLGFFFTSYPAWQLGFSTMIGQVLINAWVYKPVAGLVAKLDPQDIAKIWAYDVLWLLILDIVKMFAGCIWEKFKPSTIDSNPALAAEKKEERKRRASRNNLMGAAVVKEGQFNTEVKQQVRRKSQMK